MTDWKTDEYLPSENRPAGKQRKRQSEFVYFVEAEVTRLIKIGVALDMTTRLRALQTGSPDKLSTVAVIRCEDPKRLEAELHSRFHKLRRHGEWFEPGAELVDYIVENARSPVEDERDQQQARTADWIRRGIIVQATTELPKGESRKAKLERYRLMRGLPA